MFRHEFSVMSEPIAGSFDLHGDGVMKQSVEQGGGNDGVSKHIAPLCEASV